MTELAASFTKTSTTTKFSCVPLAPSVLAAKSFTQCAVNNLYYPCLGLFNMVSLVTCTLLCCPRTRTCFAPCDSEMQGQSPTKMMVARYLSLWGHNNHTSFYLVKLGYFHLVDVTVVVVNSPYWH